MNKVAAILTVSISILFFGMFAHALETTKGMKQDYEKFKQEMSAKMQNLDEKINELREKSALKSDQMKTEAIADLEKSRDELRNEIDSLEEKTSSNWKKLKRKMSAKMEILNKKTQKLLKD